MRAKAGAAVRLPLDVEEDHARMIREKATGQIVLNYQEGRLLVVDERRTRKRKPNLLNLPSAGSREASAVRTE